MNQVSSTPPASGTAEGSRAQAGGLGQRLLLLIGARRSGTTWLGKIFDSHPDVLYRHEPDTVLRTRVFPDFCSADDIAAHRAQAHDYLLRLADVRTLKSAGSLPLLPKSYQDSAAFRLRRAVVLGLKLCEQLPLLKGPVRRIAIPDLLGSAAAVAHRA